MRLLLSLLCGVLTLSDVYARKPSVLFEMPCSIESDRGRCIVVVETDAGPHRFALDTGTSYTTIRKKLCEKLQLTETGRIIGKDFEGHRASIVTARLPRLRMGEAEFENLTVDVLPDSSYVWCLGIDGLIGSDLLRKFVIRFTDSALLFARDYRAFEDLDRNAAAPIHFFAKCPFLDLTIGDGTHDLEIRALFDSGSSTLVNLRYAECLLSIDRKLLRNVRRTSGRPSHTGWTNRSAESEAVRGVVPELRLAGTTLKEIPLEETHGDTNNIGLPLLRYGSIVIDYRGKRFWLIPHPEAPEPPDTTIRNVGFAFDRNRLVVGRIWDETLEEVIATGDRILRIGSYDVSEIDPCAIIRGEIRGDRPEITVERKDGTIVTVPIKRL